MSQFKTVLPVNVDEVIRLLPRESFVESVDFNETTRAVEVVWSNRNLHTKLTVPTDFPLQMLHDRGIPVGAEIRKAQIVVAPTLETTEPGEQNVTVIEKPVAKAGRRGKQQ